VMRWSGYEIEIKKVDVIWFKLMNFEPSWSM